MFLSLTGFAGFFSAQTATIIKWWTMLSDIRQFDESTLSYTEVWFRFFLSRTTTWHSSNGWTMFKDHSPRLALTGVWHLTYILYTPTQNPWLQYCLLLLRPNKSSPEVYCLKLLLLRIEKTLQCFT
jgi:hypothetical protein